MHTFEPRARQPLPDAGLAHVNIGLSQVADKACSPWEDDLQRSRSGRTSWE
jgi:hypothetical protein